MVNGDCWLQLLSLSTSEFGICIYIDYRNHVCFANAVSIEHNVFDEKIHTLIKQKSRTLLFLFFFFFFFSLFACCMDLTIANQGGSTTVQRDYRKGNWNLQETLVLIEAKKMDDERRMKRQGVTSERGKPAELRWKWVEDYCWNKGCFRSQNQCNDKWDNLMRDFKKVREFEKRAGERGGGGAEEKSYWRMEKIERKDNNLPSNMLLVIYDALVAVVDRKCLTPPPPMAVPTIVEKSTTHFLSSHSMPSPIQQCPIPQTTSTVLLSLPPPLPPATAEPPSSHPSAQPLPTVGTLLFHTKCRIHSTLIRSKHRFFIKIIFIGEIDVKYTVFMSSIIPFLVKILSWSRILRPNLCMDLTLFLKLNFVGCY